MKRQRTRQRIERGTDFEDKAFKMVFDPQDYGVRTQSEVAAICNVSKKAIWEVEQRFLRKIKQAVISDASLRRMAVEMGLSGVAR